MGDLEKYYTLAPVVTKCIELIKENIPKWDSFVWIDMSAGDNTFLKMLKPQRSAVFDISPGDEQVMEKDWFSVKTADVPFDGPAVICFNPPFGSRGKLARRMFDHALTQFDVEYFVLIAPFNSWNHLQAGYRVEHAERLAARSFWNCEKQESFAFVTVFCILQKGSASKTPPLPSKYILKTACQVHVETVDDFDIIVSNTGGGTMQTIFVKLELWTLYKKKHVVGKYTTPDASKINVTKYHNFVSFKFSPDVKKSHVIRLAQELPDRIPAHAYWSNPIKIKSEDLREIVGSLLCSIIKNEHF